MCSKALPISKAELILGKRKLSYHTTMLLKPPISLTTIIITNQSVNQTEVNVEKQK